VSQFRRFGLPSGPVSGNADRAAHLKRLSDMRSGREAQPNDLEFGRCLLSIPELDYAVLLHRFPDLNSRDAETKTRAWKKFARDPASLPYRIR
jgi:hypothetical protein